MEQVKVSELASEFDLKNSVVISELKKIGVWVPSPDTAVDSDIANRIRRRLQLILEAEQEEKEKKAEKAKTKKTAPPKSKKTIKELGKPRRRVAKAAQAEAEEEAKKPESPLAGSLKPRKGRRSVYQKLEAAEKETEVSERKEVTIDDEPVIEKVEAQLSAEVLEQVQAPAPLEPQIEKEPSPPATPVRPSKPKEEPKVTKPVAPPAEEPAEAATVQPVPAPVAESGTPVAEPTAPSPPAEEVPPKVGEAGAEPAPAPVVEEVKPRRKRARDRAKVTVTGPREITFSEKVTVKSLSEKLGVKSSEVIRILMQKGIMASINQVLDEEVIEEICTQFEVIPQFVTFEEAVAQEEQAEDRPEDLVPRAPVVTVMGHVDHGKTSLLDYIRKTRVAASEAGGITQHIGAYHVQVKDNRIVFIDTPGHEAFTRMRARGAQATDIVILVVAADDGVMPQTLEAINHARAANVPIIVAINKIDKPDAQPQRVKQELSQHGLQPEDWGGDTVTVEVSAIDGTNIDLLLEMILLVADLLDLKANPKRMATGVVLEAKLERGRGAVATVLVQNGTLHVGDNFIAGTAYGKIRAMFDDRGEPVTEAGPSSAVEILGLQGIPQAGDNFQAVEDAAKAREIVEFRQEKQREKELAKTSRVSLDDLYAQMQAGEVKELPLVLKADTQGSLEVLEDTVLKLSTDKVKINVIHKSVGAISESDVLLASASNAIVIGFNVRPEQTAQAAAEHEGVDVRLYTVIYDVAQEIEQAMLGLLEPTIEEKILGRAEVRETFRVPKFGTIAGSYVLEGTVSRGAEVRVLRDNVVIYQGRIDSLRRFKEDVGEVKSGYECGISVANFNDIKVGDVLEAFTKQEVKPQLT